MFQPHTLAPRLGGLYLPGIDGNYASTPNAPSLNIAGDLELVVRYAPDSWQRAANQRIMLKFTNNVGYWFSHVADGTVELILGGSSVKIIRSTASFPSAAGGKAQDWKPLWLRVTHDVDDGGGAQSVTRFWWAPDQEQEPDGWFALGASVYTPGVMAIGGSTSDMFVGSGTTQSPKAIIYEVIVRDGIDGTEVAHPVFRNAPTRWVTPGVKAHDGQRVWTITGDRWEWR